MDPENHVWLSGGLQNAGQGHRKSTIMALFPSSLLPPHRYPYSRYLGPKFRAECLSKGTCSSNFRRIAPINLILLKIRAVSPKKLNFHAIFGRSPRFGGPIFGSAGSRPENSVYPALHIMYCLLYIAINLHNVNPTYCLPCPCPLPAITGAPKIAVPLRAAK